MLPASLPMWRQSGLGPSMTPEFLDPVPLPSDYHKVGHTHFTDKHNCVKGFTCVVVMITFCILRWILCRSAGRQGLCLWDIPSHSPCRPSDSSTARIQSCPCKNKGLNWDGIWPSQVTISVSPPPEGHPRQGLWHYCSLHGPTQYCLSEKGKGSSSGTGDWVGQCSYIPRWH